MYKTVVMIIASCVHGNRGEKKGWKENKSIDALRLYAPLMSRWPGDFAINFELCHVQLLFPFQFLYALILFANLLPVLAPSLPRTSKGIRFFSKLVSELWSYPFGLEKVNVLFTSNTQHYTTLQLCPGGVQLKTLLLKKLLNTRTPTMHISNSSCHIVKEVTKRVRVAGSR